MHAAALQSNADAFPVLKAFQDYLEAERQRARRRMIWLSGFFLAALVVIVGGMLIAGILAFNHYTRSVDRLQEALIQSVLRDPPATPRGITPDSEQYAALAANLDARLAQQLERVDGRVATIDSRAATHQTELARLYAALGELQATNQLLRSEMLSAQAEWPNLAANLASQIVATASFARPETSEPPVGVPPSTPEPPTATERTVAPAERPQPVADAALPIRRPSSAPIVAADEPTPTPAGFRETTLGIASPGDTDAMPWRLLIPE